MRLIWYNRDEFSDQDLAQAKAVSNRLLGQEKKVDPVGEYFFSGTMMQSPFQYQNSMNSYSHVARPSSIPFELQNEKE